MRVAGGSAAGAEAVMALSSGVHNISDERSNHSFITKENSGLPRRTSLKRALPYERAPRPPLRKGSSANQIAVEASSEEESSAEEHAED